MGWRGTAPLVGRPDEEELRRLMEINRAVCICCRTKDSSITKASAAERREGLSSEHQHCHGTSTVTAPALSRHQHQHGTSTSTAPAPARHQHQHGTSTSTATTTTTTTTTSTDTDSRRSCGTSIAYDTGDDLLSPRLRSTIME
ncbi:hypothetical protein E6O75_ATG02398 [Venturia nashicola]|uniref:Uncharacterized protein n=1 Tax=Venturia nashicola TaxID=86259 RepID=A0A4Z1P4Y3_9PEZI|nr:hypothetical protein E6O75_ATG02398 [Venturia nashicola]